MVPVGTILMWAGGTDGIPTGWLYCDGRVVNQSAYPTLFQIIGHHYGNPPPGSNYDPDKQFFLPDLRGRFVRGVDDGAGRDPDVNTRVDMQNPNTPSAGVGSVQADDFRSHTHAYDHFPNAHGNIAAGQNSWENGMSQTGPAGGNETRPINAALNFIIKAQQ